MNSSLGLFIEFLVLVSAGRKLMAGLDDEEIDQRIMLVERLRQLDERALAGPDNWWAVIVEQMADGLL